MAFSPIVINNQQITLLAPQPSKTYAINFNTGEVENRLIDGVEAVRQFIQKAIYTERFRYMAYSDAYGCEMLSLVGESLPMELLQMEVVRMIKEAIEYDERIERAINFKMSRSGDKLMAAFDVQLTSGVIIREEAVL